MLAKYVGSRYDSYGNVNGKLLQLTYNNKVTDSLAGIPLAEAGQSHMRNRGFDSHSQHLQGFDPKAPPKSRP